MRAPRLLLPCALTTLPLLSLLSLLSLLLLACSSESADTDAKARVEREFLASVQGEWVGVLKESATLEARVIRESPMRLIVREGEPARVEYPTLRCRGALRPAPLGTPPPTASVGRFQLEVEAPGLSPCMSGLVRITRSGEGLEYVFLGDSLRQVRAALLPQPEG